MNEYEFEPVRGLPEELPADERILWQGAPRWQGLARHAFHAAKVAIYFTLLAAIHVAMRLQGGDPLGEVAQGAGWLVVLGAIATGLLVMMGWLYARTTVYTLTDKRLVMRIGVAIPMMVNIPLARVDGVHLKLFKDGSGNIALAMSPEQRVSHWVVWPHARPWHYAPAEPMLRDIPDADALAHQLTDLAKENVPPAKVAIPAAGAPVSNDRNPASVPRQASAMS